MTIEKLARFIVEDYWDGAIGDERYLVHVEREVQRMKHDLRLQLNDPKLAMVYVEVEDKDGTQEREVEESYLRKYTD
jgi:hypothetical protein